MTQYADNNRKVATITSLVSVALPILFLLKPYSYGFDDLYLTGTLCLSILCIIQSHGSVRVNKPGKALLLFTLIWIIRLGFNSVFGETPFAIGTLKIWAQYLLSSLVIVILIHYLDCDLMYKTWKICGVILGITLIIQSIQIYILNQTVYPIQLMKPVLSSVTSDNWHTAVSRPVGLFTEPAATCSYLLPLVFLAIRKRDIKTAILFSFFILITTSTSGLISVGFLWMYFAFKTSNDKRIRTTVVGLFVVFFVAVNFLPVFSDSVSKLQFELSGTSNNFLGRVLRGWLIYFSMNGWDKLFGANMTDLNQYVLSNSSLRTYAPQIATYYGYSFYFNTAHRIMIQTGIVGGIIYSYTLRKIYKTCSDYIRPYFWMVILQMFFMWNLFNSNFYMIQMFVILGFGNIEKENTLRTYNEAY